MPLLIRTCWKPTICKKAPKKLLCGQKAQNWGPEDSLKQYVGAEIYFYRPIDPRSRV